MSYVDLIIKYLSGDLSREEATSFEKELESNDALKEAFEEQSAAYELIRMGYGVTIFEALPVAGGHPQLSGITIPNAIWSGKLLVKFYEATVLGEIANTE